MPDGLFRLLNSLRWFVRPLTGSLFRAPEAEGRSRTVQTLRHVFPLADAGSIQVLAAICLPLSMPAGACLPPDGEPPDAIYIVIAGQCAAYRPTANGQELLLDRFGAGDLVGDVGLLGGFPQAVTLRALRDSALLQVSRKALHRAAARCPDVLLVLCSRVIERLQKAPARSLTPRTSRTFAVVPADPTIDLTPVVQKIAATFETFGTVTVLSAERGSEQTPGWFSDIERCFDFVLFQGDGSRTAWTRFCLEQCDRIVLVAHGDTEPSQCATFGPDGIEIPQHTPLSLLLLWPQTIVPARATAWLRLINPHGHHHVRSPADLERASRLIAGLGVGLVLSGGGARALAHVGVIAALRQHGIQIDAVGGTSIGGIVAAVFALEWNLTATVRSLASAFSRRRFSDFAVPRTALYSERAFARTLGQCFGDLAIEDSPMPLFCVSTNLTAGHSTVHRSGRLVTWLRATSAVPGICPPIIEQNIVYVDGGVLNNLPINAMRELGVGTVIAVDVGSSLSTQARSDGVDLPNILDLLWRVGTIGSDRATNDICDRDVVLKPDVAKIGLFDWGGGERAIAAGHQVALEHLDEIKVAAAGKGGAPPLAAGPLAVACDSPPFTGRQDLGAPSAAFSRTQQPYRRLRRLLTLVQGSFTVSSRVT